MKTFVTLFPICENVHLTKDLGQIPFFMNKVYHYDSKIVCYNNGTYTNLEGEVKGLKIEFIEDTGRISFLEKSVLKYIYRNATKTDVLNLYIFSKYTFVYGILYKVMNPKGALFLKLDGYNETFAEESKVIHSTKPLKNFILKKLERAFLKRVDLISIENSEGEKLVRRKYPSIQDRIMFLPVGVNDRYISDLYNSKHRSFDEKENIILTVGRIGEEIKNHEMILRALARLDLKDWKMVFVGPVNPVFQARLAGFFEMNPHLKERIIFTGNISDRKELYEWYDRSKLFCMTSRKESFCHSIAEALYFGNYIVGTEGIMSMKDVSDEGKYGVILPCDNDIALAEVLQGFINDDSALRKLSPEIKQFARKHFVWSRIIAKVKQRLENNN